MQLSFIYSCVHQALLLLRSVAACVIHGCLKVGVNLLIFTLHPMRVGATLMSSFLFNVSLCLLACTATIQFCVQAFSLYANETAIYQIFGNQVQPLHVGINHRLPTCLCILRIGMTPAPMQHGSVGVLQVVNIQGLGWLYRTNIFFYCMFGFIGLSILWFSIKGPEPFKRRGKFDAYAEG